jgi:hypothetical protein
VIEAHDGEFIWQAEMMNDAPVSHSWSYTRRPQLRSLYLPLFDDPYENFASQVFHQVPLRTPYSPNLPRSQSGWETVEIPLSGPLVNQSAPIDLCEQLLEELDSAFNRGDGEYLHWQQKQVTPEAIDRLAKQVEEGDLLARGETFNITLNIQGQETTRNKRVRSVASYPITLYDSDGAPVTATLGCSLSN